MIHDIIPGSHYDTNKEQTLITWGADQLHIIADFDRSITKAFVNGIYKSSLISVLYTEWYLSKEYQQAAQTLFEKYHPIEVDESIPLAKRKQHMQTWRVEHKQLLITE
jgi:hypothetical protein